MSFNDTGTPEGGDGGPDYDVRPVRNDIDSSGRTEERSSPPDGRYERSVRGVTAGPQPISFPGSVDAI